MAPRVFVVDDDDSIRDIVARYLDKDGYEVQVFSSIDQMQATNLAVPDIYVLDIMMPGQSGLEFCKKLRDQSDIPVIFISARGDELDRIIGLELGADDYLTKPFSPRELVTRVKTILKRTKPKDPPSDCILIGNTSIYRSQREVRSNDLIDLTTKDFTLLVHLCENPSRAFTREQLLDYVWGYEYVGDVRAVDDLIKRLRKKLKEGGSDVEVQTVWGYGYKVVV